MEIRDNRAKEWFWLDNEYLNGYAKHLGTTCTVVYISLCRHSDNKTQECFPSMDTIAEENGMKRNAVSRAIKKLEDWNIISVKKEYDKKTKKRKNNVYTLLAKSEWKEKPCTLKIHGEPCTPKEETHAPLEGSNNTHINNTNNGEDSPFVWEDYLEKMVDKGNQRHIRIIGAYFKIRGKRFDALSEVTTAIKRHVKPAKELIGFPNSKIGEAMRKLNYDFPAFTLETVLKELTK